MRRENRAFRAKSALRLKYEAESEVLRRKLGDLEQIRATLGLSQRKICQLLFVDPSAWTRWTRRGEAAPPHIYRSLQWYLALEEKYPALDVHFWLSSVSRPAVSETRDYVESQRVLERTTQEIAEVRNEISRSQMLWQEKFAEFCQAQGAKHWRWAAAGLFGFGLLIGFGIGYFAF